MAPFAFLSLALAASAAALSLPSQIGADDKKLVSLPLVRQVREHTVLRRRNNDVPVYNASSVSYLIQMSIGTPGQKVLVAIDTGSDELWVDPNCQTSDTIEQETECQSDGVYSRSSSNTSVLTQMTTDIKYGKGEAELRYVYDNITLPNTTLHISQQMFGIATASTELNEGILGLGWGNGVNLNYSNLVDQMYLQNQTNTRAFSLALGDKDYSNGGLLIFGGVDTKKYVGNLVTRPILGPQNGENLARYWVELDGFTLNSGSSTTDTYISGSSDSIAVVLDSGSTLSYLPSSIVTKLASDLNARYDTADQVYIADCSLASGDKSLHFSFGNATIKVPFNVFIWEAGTNVCVLGALPATDGINILGDSVLRAGYFVFDQDSKAIHMAQYANCGQNEQVLPAGNGTAASFVGQCSESDTQGSSSGSVASVSINIWLAVIAVAVPIAFNLM